MPAATGAATVATTRPSSSSSSPFWSETFGSHEWLSIACSGKRPIPSHGVAYASSSASRIGAVTAVTAAFSAPSSIASTRSKYSSTGLATCSAQLRRSKAPTIIAYASSPAALSRLLRPAGRSIPVAGFLPLNPLLFRPLARTAAASAPCDSRSIAFWLSSGCSFERCAISFSPC